MILMAPAVTAEVAGSSPVVPAIHSKVLRNEWRPKVTDFRRCKKVQLPAPSAGYLAHNLNHFSVMLRVQRCTFPRWQ